MVSTLLRRSGIALGLIADHIGWVPEYIYQVGVGIHCQELEVFVEAWPKVVMTGYEAHPLVYEAVKDRYPGTIHNLGISKRPGIATLYSKKRHKDGSSLYKFHDDIDVEEFKVKVDTLDNQVPEGPKSNRTLLWLDCEGSELDALKGAENFIKRVEVVNVELTSNPVSNEWPSQVSIDIWLRDRGFRRQWIHTQRSALGQCDVIYVRPYLFKSEYCCCPCEIGSYCGG